MSLLTTWHGYSGGPRYSPSSGRARYRLQPVNVEDLAELAVAAGQAGGNLVMDAAGPEIFTFEEMVRFIARAVGSRALMVHVRPGLALFLSRLVGAIVKDRVLTRDEIEGLMANLLVSSEAPTGRTRFSEWLSQNAASVGARYASEMELHFRERTARPPRS